jgi:hypothetical protein
MRAFMIVSLVLLSTAIRAQSTGIDRLTWLQGCWHSTSGARTVEEHWMAPRGRSMLGMSRTVNNGALVEHEFIVLREEGGGFVYEANPSRQAPARFNSREVGESSILFENPSHDFPQRIGYQRQGTDGLLAWIEGSMNGKPRRVEFPYRRAACS